MKKIHYRVRTCGRVMAYGCGAAGMPNSVCSTDWKTVTCALCKRTDGYREARLADTPGRKVLVDHNRLQHLRYLVWRVRAYVDPGALPTHVPPDLWEAMCDDVDTMCITARPGVPECP